MLFPAVGVHRTGLFVTVVGGLDMRLLSKAERSLTLDVSYFSYRDACCLFLGDRALQIIVF